MPLSVVFLAAVYYIKVPAFRNAVDERTTIVNGLLGRFVQESGTKVIVLRGELDPMFAKSKEGREPGQVPAVATPAPAITKGPEAVSPTAPVAPVQASATPAPVAADFQTIAADRTKWPKKVALTKAVTFPAVLNGKIVGSLVAPAGTEANLVQITGGKLGLEFNGGGASVPVGETDFLRRVQVH